MEVPMVDGVIRWSLAIVLVVALLAVASVYLT